MAITLKTDKSGLVIVDRARGKRNWSALAAAWCEAASVSVSTLKRFRERKAIQKDSFIAICKAVGIEDWERVVAAPIPEDSVLRQCSRRAKKRIAEEVLSNLEHLDAQVAFVERAFVERPIEAQRQTIQQHIVPALRKDISSGYRQLARRSEAADLTLDFQRHPLRIEANVSIVQIMVNL